MKQTPHPAILLRRLSVRVCESAHESILCKWHGLPAIECSSFCNVHRHEVDELDEGDEGDEGSKAVLSFGVILLAWFPRCCGLFPLPVFEEGAGGLELASVGQATKSMRLSEIFGSGV